LSHWVSTPSLNVSTPFILPESQWLFYAFFKLRTSLYTAEIAKSNLFGLDIDGRCFHLAYFAFVMKVHSFGRRFLSLGIVIHSWRNNAGQSDKSGRQVPASRFPVCKRNRFTAKRAGF
jgi:hypothetical protein